MEAKRLHYLFTPNKNNLGRQFESTAVPGERHLTPSATTTHSDRLIKESRIFICSDLQQNFF